MAPIPRRKALAYKQNPQNILQFTRGIEPQRLNPQYGLVRVTALDAGNVDLSKAGVISKTADNISETATRKWAGETGADVTDSENVNAAGATMNADTDVSGNAWVLDEDTMDSDDATKVPTQQSVKAYADGYHPSGEIRLTPKESSSGPEGTIYYDSDDDHVYVATE
jgi:hypothetical protein